MNDADFKEFHKQLNVYADALAHMKHTCHNLRDPMTGEQAEVIDRVVVILRELAREGLKHAKSKVTNDNNGAKK